MSPLSPIVSRKLRSSHQTYLGPDTQNKLTIFDDHQKIIPERAFIFKLPDEILSGILELAVTNVQPSWRDCKPYTYRDTKSLSLICRRFNRITNALLYHTIEVEIGSSKSSSKSSTRKLHATLQRNPWQRPYCKELSISIDGEQESLPVTDFTIAADFVSWLTRVRHLTIIGRFHRKYDGEDCKEPATSTLIRRAAKSMPEIVHLTLSKRCWPPYLTNITELIDSQSLQKLDLWGFHRYDEERTTAIILAPEVFLSFFNHISSDIHRALEHIVRLWETTEADTYF